MTDAELRILLAIVAISLTVLITEAVLADNRRAQDSWTS